MDMASGTATAVNATSGVEPVSVRATPLIAAAYVAALAYVWMEAFLRYFATNTTLLANLVLFNARDGDIAAMWLTMGIVAAVAFGIAFLAFRRKASVGSLTLWTVLLIVSAIVAPLIGEIGTPIGI